MKEHLSNDVDEANYDRGYTISLFISVIIMLCITRGKFDLLSADLVKICVCLFILPEILIVPLKKIQTVFFTTLLFAKGAPTLFKAIREGRDISENF